MTIFVELTSSIRFAVVTSSLNGEWVELTLTNKVSKKVRIVLGSYIKYKIKMSIYNAIIVLKDSVELLLYD